MTLYRDKQTGEVASAVRDDLSGVWSVRRTGGGGAGFVASPEWFAGRFEELSGPVPNAELPAAFADDPEEGLHPPLYPPLLFQPPAVKADADMDSYVTNLTCYRSAHRPPLIARIPSGFDPERVSVVDPALVKSVARTGPLGM